jgi:hypothetical protein
VSAELIESADAAPAPLEQLIPESGQSIEHRMQFSDGTAA